MTLIHFPSPDEISEKVITEYLPQAISVLNFSKAFEAEYLAEAQRLLLEFKQAKSESFPVVLPAWIHELPPEQRDEVIGLITIGCRRFADQLTTPLCRMASIAAWTVTEARRQAREAGLNVVPPPEMF